MRFLAPALSILLTPLVAVLPLYGQLPAPLPANGTPAPSTFTLQVVSAEANSLTVEVKDGSGAAVTNAAVVFRLPDSDPSGTFADGTRSAIAYTDPTGHAQSGAIRWSEGPGTVDVRITAAQGEVHAGLLFQHIPAAAVLVVPPSVVVAPAAHLTPGVLPVAKPSPGVVVETVAAKPAHRRPATAPHPADEDEDTAGDSGAATSAALDDDSPDANVPIRHAIRTGAAEGEAPGVSVTSAGSDVPSGHSKKKWIIMLAAAAGAGAAIALLHMKSGSSAASGTSIGAPSISIGHP